MKEVSQSNPLLRLTPKTVPNQTARPTAPPADQFVGAAVSPEWLLKPAKAALIGATLAMGVAFGCPFAR